MKYEGEFNVLKCYNNKHYEIAKLSFLVEGEVLSVPSLPFIMMRLDKPHGKADNEGWRFEVDGIKYFVAPKELQCAIRAYNKEKLKDPMGRFYDVWQSN